MRFPPISNRKDVASFSNRIRLLDELIEQAAFNQALIAHPEDEFAPVLVGDLTQFVDTNAGVTHYIQQFVCFPA